MTPAERDEDAEAGTERRAFHDELRRRNLPILMWSAVIFNVMYLSWSAFDYYLAPQHWRHFASLRVVAVLINTAVAVLVWWRFRRRTWEGFALWLFTFGAFVAVMLPRAGESFSPYVMGFTLILFGSGILPFWPPRWAVGSALASLVAAVFAFVLLPSDIAGQDLVAGAFFVSTGVGLSLVMAAFKYQLAWNDYTATNKLAQASRELGAALDQLKEVDRQKSKFFANVSHELRTPLTLILGPLDELTLSIQDPDARHTVRVVRRNAQRLMRLIDDLLDLSRLDAGGLRLNIADVDLGAVAAGVVENAQPAATKKNVALRCENTTDGHAILGDSHRLEIVVTNLVSNAIKYTPPGGSVQVRVSEDADGITVAVQDTGPGIPGGDLPRVFDRFFQVPGHDRRGGGVGIGLALARELIALHGGTMNVDSAVGEGSRFWFRLPYGRDHIRPEAIERRRSFRPEGPSRRASDLPLDIAGDEPSAPTAPLDAKPLVKQEPIRMAGRRPRILLAEDQSELREFIARLLREDHDVITVHDGQAAWEQLERTVPDVIVSDVMMPRMSGTELCRKVKTSEHLASTPVILLTARVGSEATLEGYSHGADDFVAKPFHPRVLVARVRAQLRLRSLALQLADREKLAGIGTLAAGILHEVRNPINAMVSAAAVLRETRREGDADAKLYDVIADAVARIRGITEALDTHVRPADQGASETCDLTRALDATLLLLQHKLGAVRVHKAYTGIPEAAAPAGPLNQVLLNLLDNALNAGAQNLWIDAHVDDERLRLRVADDGGGIEPRHRSQIFDPFFTTRQPGEGQGLGLYLSKQIIQRHHGELWCQDREGGGTEFWLAIPTAR